MPGCGFDVSSSLPLFWLSSVRLPAPTMIRARAVLPRARVERMLGTRPRAPAARAVVARAVRAEPPWWVVRAVRRWTVPRVVVPKTAGMADASMNSAAKRCGRAAMSAVRSPTCARSTSASRSAPSVRTAKTAPRANTVSPAWARRTLTLVMRAELARSQRRPPAVAFRARRCARRV